MDDHIESAWKGLTGAVSGVESIQDKRVTVLQLHVEELRRQAHGQTVRAHGPTTPATGQ